MRAKRICKETGKLSFKSARQAQNAMRHVLKRSPYITGEELETYQCSCGRWHFGHDWWKRLDRWQRMDLGRA